MMLWSVIGVLFLLGACQPKEEWKPLFNGQNLDGWRHYLSKPDSAFDLMGLERDPQGQYAALGNQDPLQVFSVLEHEGKSCLRISGQVIGNLYTKQSYRNYHLQLTFKWGTKKWAWMEGRPKDGGVLYHYHHFSGQAGVRHECQIHAGDIGSYWARQTKVDIPGYYSSQLPMAIQQARPFLADLVPEIRDTMLIFHPDSALQHFDGHNRWQIAIADPATEKPDQWNQLDIFCYQNHALHYLNGHLNMVLLNAHLQVGEQWVKMDSGTIQIQSEGAEIFFHDIRIRPLEKMPEALTSYLD
ncbi:MAG: DUF1080 domain-containing protein [Bacteroidota bacterium]